MGEKGNLCHIKTDPGPLLTNHRSQAADAFLKWCGYSALTGPHDYYNAQWYRSWRLVGSTEGDG